MAVAARRDKYDLKDHEFEKLETQDRRNDNFQVLEREDVLETRSKADLLARLRPVVVGGYDKKDVRELVEELQQNLERMKVQMEEQIAVICKEKFQVMQDRKLYKEQLRVAENSITELRSCLKDMDQLTEKANVQEKDLTELHEKLHQLDNVCTEYEEVRQERDHLEVLLGEKETRLEELDQTLSELNQKVFEQTEEKQRMEAQLLGLQREFEERKKTLTEHTVQEIEEKKKELEMLESMYQQKNRDYDALKESYEEKLVELTRLQSESLHKGTISEEEKAKLRSEIEQRIKRETELEKTALREAAEEQVRRKIEENNQLKEAQAEKDANFERLKANYDEKLIELERLQADYDSKMEELDRLQDNYIDKVMEFDDMKAEFTKKVQELKDRQQVIVEAAPQSSQAEARRSAYEQGENELAVLMGDMERQRDAFQSNSDEVRGTRQNFASFMEQLSNGVENFGEAYQLLNDQQDLESISLVQEKTQEVLESRTGMAVTDNEFVEKVYGDPNDGTEYKVKITKTRRQVTYKKEPEGRFANSNIAGLLRQLEDE